MRIILRKGMFMGADTQYIIVKTIPVVLLIFKVSRKRRNNQCLKNGYRNQTDFRRWVKAVKVATCAIIA